MANSGSDNISAYKISASSGGLIQMKGSPFAAAGEPLGVAIDSTGKFAYVTNFGSNNVSAYTINAKSCALAQVKGSPFEAGTWPYGIATCRVKAGKCIPSPL